MEKQGEGRVWEVASAKGGLDMAASRRALGLSLRFRDRGGGGSKGRLGRCLGCRRCGWRGRGRVRAALLWRICRRRLCLRGPGVCEWGVVSWGGGTEWVGKLETGEAYEHNVLDIVEGHSSCW